MLEKQAFGFAQFQAAPASLLDEIIETTEREDAEQARWEEQDRAAARDYKARMATLPVCPGCDQRHY